MITDEGKRLGAHWDRIGPTELNRYLIQEVEHPAYNPQSILIRAFLIDRLFPAEGDAIVEEELYFSACACFALLGQREGWFPALYRKLKQGCDDDGLPAFLRGESRERFGPAFDLMELYSEIAICLSVGFDDFSSPFEKTWRTFLGGRRSEGCEVLELGCGSANDYRFLEQFGVAEFLEYRGIDVSSSNVRNAASRFPKVTFTLDDVCDLDAKDKTVDVAFAFDLYEHLSPSSISTALSESLRITRDELWISLFNAEHIAHHEIRPEGDYHWNLLSIPELAAEIETEGFEAESISIAQELEGRFEGYRHYNTEAHILIARRKQTTQEKQSS